MTNTFRTALSVPSATPFHLRWRTAISVPDLTRASSCLYAMFARAAADALVYSATLQGDVLQER